MKVLLTADTVGGVWTYAVELIRALGQLHVEIALATMGASLNSDQRKEINRLRNVEVYESAFKLEWMESPWQDVYEAGHWLLDVEQLVRPDVIHLNGYPHGTLPWHAPVMVVGHSCVLSWWQAVKGEPAPAAWDVYRREVRRGIQAADLVVAPSIAMLSALDRHYGPLRTARVISNGRSARHFRPDRPWHKEPFVFAAGRLWDEAKNIGALERSAPHLTWPVYIAGNGKHPGGGNVWERQEQHLHALGYLPPHEIAAWLKRASIYALPARYEPFGLSILEAALAGCALVLGDISSLREIWDGAAAFVLPDDEAALLQTLEKLITQPRWCETLASRARARALQYTPRRMAAAYQGVYTELIALRAQQPLQRHSLRQVPSLAESEFAGWPQ